MRRFSFGLLLAGMLAGLGSSAHALPFTGTLLFKVDTLPAVSLSGSGSGDPTQPSISANAFVGTSTVPVFGQPPITQVVLTLSPRSPSWP